MSGGPGSKTLLVPSCPSVCEKMSLAASLVRKPTMHRYISTKVLLAEGQETPFADHCRNYENMYRALQTELQNLKDQVQELHRDLTKHHSLVKTEIMSEIVQKSLQMDVQIASEYSSVEMMRSAFEETWEETYQRVANEQEIYEAQLHDLLQLKQENSYLTTITRQIAPYVRSIVKVKERLEPRLQEAKERGDPLESLLKVHDDGSSGDLQHSKGKHQEQTPEPNAESEVLGPTEDPLPKSKDHGRNKAKSRAESSLQMPGSRNGAKEEGSQDAELLLC